MQDVSGGLGNGLELMVGGTLAFVVYQRGLTAGLPEGLSPEQAEAATGSVGGALAVGRDAEGGEGQALVQAAQESFTAPTQAVYLLSAVVLLLLSVMVIRGLQDARLDPGGSAEDE